MGFRYPYLKIFAVKGAGNLSREALREPVEPGSRASGCAKESTACQQLPPGIVALHDDPPLRAWTRVHMYMRVQVGLT
jgi:hypothetical protein